MSTLSIENTKMSSKNAYSLIEGETIELSSKDATKALLTMIEHLETLGQVLGTVRQLKDVKTKLIKEYEEKTQTLEQDYQVKLKELKTKQLSLQGSLGNLATRQKQEQAKLTKLQEEFQLLKTKYDALQKEYDTLARSPVKAITKTKK